MALFKRKSSIPSTLAVTDFWEWWAEARSTISPHEPSPTTEELNRRVQAIHRELAWHFGPGEDSEHRLTVTGGGVAEVRSSAERWLRAAPASDATWEFRSSQEADPSPLENTIEIGGQTLELSAVRFAIENDLTGRRVHVGVFHPDFASVPLQLAQQVTFLSLDWALGEDAVERWLGAIETLTAAPSEPETVAALQQAVAEQVSERVVDTWIVAEWTTDDGYPGLASFRSDIRWIDHPTFDLYHRIVALYVGQENGMPHPEGLEDLRVLEDALQTAIGARGVIVAHETADARRTFHVYTDGQDQNVTDALLAAAKRPHVSVQSTADPSWQSVREFTG